MATPRSAGLDRVCSTCGRPAAPHEYFCHRCTTRLPDPVGHVSASERARMAAATRPEPGGPVLLTVLGVVVVVGALIAAAVVAYVRLDPFAPDPPGPAAVVTSYFEAIEDGDCDAATDLEAPAYRSGARCQGDVETFDQVDTEIRIEDELVLDDDASVKVRFTVEDRAFLRCTLDLGRAETWLIQDAVCEEPTAKP